MISKQYFRIKKNEEPYSRCICRHPELIENYEKAVADTTQTWEVHHRLESCFTYKFLVEMDSANKRQGEARKGKFINRKDMSKKVLCVETGEVFESMMDAQRKTGIDYRGISDVCNGKLKTTGGYHWRLV